MVAIVTGASDGIGLRIAKSLNAQGYTVHDISRSANCCSGAYHHSVDVSDSDRLRYELNEIIRLEKCVDLLVICAGVSLASPGDETALRDSRYLFDVNFWGAVVAASTVSRAMKRNGKGRIIFISSLTGVTALPHLGFYSASKAALTAYASALRAELAPFGVAVSTIAPGGVKTNFSGKRKKYDCNAPGLRRAIKVITAIEQNCVKPEAVAGKVLELVESEKPAGFTTVGALNRFLLHSLRILPVRTVQNLLTMLFVGPLAAATKDLPIQKQEMRI